MEQQNHIETNEYQEEKQVKQKKKGSTVKGIVIGVIATLLICWTGMNVACMVTGTQILITEKDAGDGNGGVLDTAAITKINELSA